MNRQRNARRLGFAGGFAVAALASTAALAQPVPIDSIDRDEHVAQINEQSIVAALSTVTGNHVVSVTPDGQPVIIATATNGLKFEVSPRACTDVEDGEEGSGDSDKGEGSAAKHCRGIMMLSSWDGVPEGRAAEFGGAVDAFLIDNPAVNAGKTDNGSPYVARYVIADYGTPQGNLVSEFANFIRSATAFQNAIAQLYSD